MPAVFLYLKSVHIYFKHINSFNLLKLFMFISINHILLWTKIFKYTCYIHAPARLIVGITALLLFIALFISRYLST